MKTFVKMLVLWCFSMVLIAPACKAQNFDPKYTPDTLVVQAEGKYQSEPDLATLKFPINVQDKELKPTYDRAAQAIAKIEDLAERNGLAKRDVSSGVLTITPYYTTSDRKKKPKSFTVQGQVVLKFHDDFSNLVISYSAMVDNKSISETPVNGRSFVNIVESRNGGGAGGGGGGTYVPPPPPPLTRPEPITVTATVQCVFAIQ